MRRRWGSLRIMVYGNVWICDVWLCLALWVGFIDQWIASVSAGRGSILEFVSEDKAIPDQIFVRV